MNSWPLAVALGALAATLGAGGYFLHHLRKERER